MKPSSKLIRVALTMRETQASGYIEPRDAIAQDWSRWFRALSLPISPILIPNDPVLAERLISDFRPTAIILSGGNDIGESDARDTTERKLLELFPHIPTLGVCRGMQLLASASNWKCVPAPDQEHIASRHSVAWSTEAETLLPQAECRPPSEVNSYHALLLPADNAPEEWRVVARHADDSAEMIVHRDLPRMGIMWHPEREEVPREFDVALFNHLQQLSL